jgi:hypothetical protein
VHATTPSAARQEVPAETIAIPADALLSAADLDVGDGGPEVIAEIGRL